MDRSRTLMVVSHFSFWRPLQFIIELCGIVLYMTIETQGKGGEQNGSVSYTHGRVTFLIFWTSSINYLIVWYSTGTSPLRSSGVR